MLDRHRALIAVALHAACGDDACPGVATAHTCRVARIDGVTPGGELGFRFGEPLDVDGDGERDLVAGARRGGNRGFGEAGVWTQGGALLARWQTEDLDALFGHVALAVPDLDGDALPDVVISAPNALVDGEPRGYVDAYSARDGSRLWRAVGARYDGFGWHVARAPDLDGDAIADLWVGAPSNPVEGHVYLVSGRTGAIVRTLVGPGDGSQFGWYVVATGDLDGDGAGDVAVGAPTELVGGARRGAVHLVSSTGAEVRMLAGELVDHRFGEMIAVLDDLDGDRSDELAIAAVGGALAPSSIPSEVTIVSAARGERLRLLVEAEPGELYGRMLATVDDLDGDGLRELAIGAPWWRGRDGRVEVRSPQDLTVLAELHGDETGWLGWHIAGAGEAGLLVSQLHAHTDTGAIELHAWR